MSEHFLLGLTSIIALGIGAQWLAWRLKLPSILLLLVSGILAGSVFSFLNPDEMFGDLLFPLVSISVAIILFEGGLSLRFTDIRGVGKIVGNLTTYGIIVTWLLAALSAHYIIHMSWQLSMLLGAILVVSGPTVIIPLLRQVRPVGKIGSIVKWEGIINDPIGAILAVLVYEVILVGGLESGTSVVIFGIVKAVFGGVVIGLSGALLIIILLRYYLVPDFLQNPVSLMVVVLAYIASGTIQPESGLLAVTVMGIALANQKYVSIRHILEFKENLRVLLISSLFIILSARLPLSQMELSNLSNWLFVAGLILVVRPVAVLLSTLKSPLKWNEKLFLSWMAPRGIVAAAVISVFAISLTESGIADSEAMISVTFQVIIGTVAVYGLTAPIVARRLKVALPNPQGVLFAGAQSWVQNIARLLHEENFNVILIDTNWRNIIEAKSKGLRAYYGNVLSEDMLAEMQLDGIGRMLAVTPNDEVNSLAVLHFEDIFGRAETYQLMPVGKSEDDRREILPSHLQGRYLFDKKASCNYLHDRFGRGAVIKKTPITDEFSYEDYLDMYGDSAVQLFIISKSNELVIKTADSRLKPEAGEMIISVIDEKEPNN